jgi:hypothetical protein
LIVENFKKVTIYGKMAKIVFTAVLWIRIQSDQELFNQVGSGKIFPNPDLDPRPNETFSDNKNFIPKVT